MTIETIPDPEDRAAFTAWALAKNEQYEASRRDYVIDHPGRDLKSEENRK